MRINFWQRETVSPVDAPQYEDAVVADAAMAHTAVSEKAVRYTALTRWILYIGVFLLPIFFLPWTTSVLELSKQTLLIAIAGGGLVVWLLGVVISGQVRYRKSVLDKAVLAMLIAAALATAFSLSPQKSLFGLSISLSDSFVTILSLTILYFLMVNVFEDKGKGVQTALVASLTLALFYGLLQMFTVYVLGFDFSHSRAFNTVGSLNSLGLLAAVALPLFLKTKVMIKRVPYLDIAKIGLVSGLAILVILNWWVLWLTAIIGMLALIAFDSVSLVLHDKGQRFHLNRFLMPMVVVVLGVFLMVVQFNLTSVKRNFPVEIGPSFNLSNQIAKNVLSKNAIVGYGPENFSVAFDEFGARALANSTLSNLKFFDGMSQIHNFLVHSGLVGALAALFLIGTVGYTLFRFKDHIVAGDLDGTKASGIFAAAAAGSVAMFLYSFNLTLLFVFFAILAMIGLVTGAKGHKVVNIEDRPAFSLASSLGFIGGLIAVLTGVYFITIHYLADVDFATAQTQGDNNIAAQQLVSAINWYPSDRYYRQASQVSLGLLTSELQTNRQSADRATRIQNLIVSSRDLAIQATKLEPKESNNWFNLGSVYESLVGLVDNADKFAEDSYREAAKLRPGDASFENRIGSMYLGKSELQRQLARSAGVNGARFNQEADAALLKAEESFKAAIELSPNYGLAIYNLAAVYDRQGKVSDAIGQIEKIAPFNAQDPNLMFQLGLLYYRANRKDDAFAAMQQAVFLNPSFANARWYLGLLYEERKDLPAAIEQMEKILETNKDNTTVQQKIADLRKGITVFPPGKVTDQQPL
jgi:tetratricopeptide (TPR) repeat protein